MYTGESFAGSEMRPLCVDGALPSAAANVRPFTEGRVSCYYTDSW